MKRIFAIVVGAVALAACISMDQIEPGLDALVGKPLSTATSVLGFPGGERNTAGMHLVQWGRTDGPTACSITLQVDAAQIVRGYQYDGNAAGCAAYIQRLNAYRKGAPS